MRRDILSPIRTKVMAYKLDGTGRDIFLSNHAHAEYLLKNKTQQIRNNYLKFGKLEHQSQYKKENKFVHYPSDGTGRDFYIKHNNGGNTIQYDWKDHIDYKFANELRVYHNFNKINPQYKDIMTLTKSRISRKQFQKLKSLSQNQLKESYRLSEPKSFTKPLPVKSYFNKYYGSVSNRFRANSLKK